MTTTLYVGQTADRKASDMTDQSAFEDEVKRIARLKWPAAATCGSEMHGGQERDGVFITEECIHLLECTVSRAKDKAQDDLRKLYQLYNEYRRTAPDKAVKCWFITRHEPTAEQRDCRTAYKSAPPALFSIVSFSHFQSSLVDAAQYLADRERHKFGSIYDPKTGNPTASIDYVDVGLLCEGAADPLTVKDVAKRLLAGDRFALLGEYGVGKSMALREIFRALALMKRNNVTPIFPIYLNLREHQGQQQPAEILERHARNIGFHTPGQLVRAWKAGYAVLLCDGFDEVSSLGLQGAWQKLHDARYQSMTGIRALLRETPESAGIAIAGRQNFFDTPDERRRALGENARWLDIRLDDFTEEQVDRLIKGFGFSGSVPSWIPSRPLLIATLFGKHQGATTPTSLLSITDASVGWDLLLDEVTQREARMEHGISGAHIRRILESLATIARKTDTGLGPLSPEDITQEFKRQCGFAPTADALVVLQRLPGLARDASSGEDSRCFVDVAFADACRAGDFVRFCQEPFRIDGGPRLSDATIVLGQTGIGVSAHTLQGEGFGVGKLTAVIQAFKKMSGMGATPADLMNLATRMNLQIGVSFNIDSVLFDRLELDTGRVDMSNVTFTNCCFGELEVPQELTSQTCPHFARCLIQSLDGRVSEKDLPADCFDSCAFEKFSQAAITTNAALELHIPAGARVLMSVLKKLYVQSLGGRKQNALYRGLDAAHQTKVDPVLRLLQANGLAEVSGRAGEPVWLPVRRQRGRVLAMLNAPSASADAVLVEARRL